MHVDTKSYVVGEIPADVVGIIVDHHVVVIPIPVVRIREVERGNAEEVSPKPESVRATAPQSPDIARTDPALEVAVLPRMFQVESGVAASRIVPNPFPIFVDVWGIGVALAIAIR